MYRMKNIIRNAGILKSGTNLTSISSTCIHTLVNVFPVYLKGYCIFFPRNGGKVGIYANFKRIARMLRKRNALEAITRGGKSVCFASIVSKQGKWISVYSVRAT